MYLARLRPPDHRLQVEDLGGDTGWVLSAVLGKSNHLAPIVDSGGVAVIAAQRGKRVHRALLPHKPEAYQARPEAAKILTQRVGSGSVRNTRDQANVVLDWPIHTAVWPSQRAEVGHPRAFLPQKSVSGLVALQVRLSRHPALVVNAVGYARRSAQCPEILDLVASVSFVVSLTLS